MWAKFFKVEINKELFKINHESLVIDKSGNLLYMQYVKIEKNLLKDFAQYSFQYALVYACTCMYLCIYLHIYLE